MSCCLCCVVTVMEMGCKEASGRGVVAVCEKRKEIHIERLRLLHKQGMAICLVGGC